VREALPRRRASARRGRAGVPRRRFPGARPDLPAPKPAISCGHVGGAMARCSGTYNTALWCRMLVKGAEWALVRPRLEVDQLIALDRMRLAIDAGTRAWPGNCLLITCINRFS